MELDMIEQIEFTPFPKMARLSRDIIITEKIDGTNAQIFIGEDGTFLTGSRTKWITPQDDNFGFSAWAYAHKEELMQLGPGRHFGEWWGQKIQRAYDLKEKRFSLFNLKRWGSPNERPSCCDVVPILYEGAFDMETIHFALNSLKEGGSWAAPGFMRPEGIVIYHTAANLCFKKTLEKDELPKGIAL